MQDVEASLDSKSVKTSFLEDWKDDESLIEAATLKTERSAQHPVLPHQCSRFVFPDGSSYQSQDKMGQDPAVPVAAPPLISKQQQPRALLTPKPKPKLLVKHKHKGDHENHQRLANDIIKINSQLFTDAIAPSPASSPVPIPIPAPSPLPEHKLRPKSSSFLKEESLRHPQSPVLHPEDELCHRSRSSQELRRASVRSAQEKLKRIPASSNQLSGSNSSAVSQLSLNSHGSSGGGAKQPSLFTESVENDSEVGVDFDVDRAFRRNRFDNLLLALLTFCCRRKWALLEGMVEGAHEGLHISGSFSTLPFHDFLASV